MKRNRATSNPPHLREKWITIMNVANCIVWAFSKNKTKQFINAFIETREAEKKPKAPKLSNSRVYEWNRSIDRSLLLGWREYAEMREKKIKIKKSIYLQLKHSDDDARPSMTWIFYNTVKVSSCDWYLKEKLINSFCLCDDEISGLLNKFFSPSEFKIIRN